MKLYTIFALTAISFLINETTFGQDIKGHIEPEIPEVKKQPSERFEYFISSGYHNVHSEINRSITVFNTTVKIEKSKWLQLHINSYYLGSSSYIMIRSKTDDGWQRLDAISLEQWQGNSAFFNGNELEIELIAAPNDKNVFFNIQEVTAGYSFTDYSQESHQTNDLENSSFTLQGCVEGENDLPEDTRIDSNNKALGRFFNWGPTGYLISNGAALTAGHDFPNNKSSIGFNVPKSQNDGTLIHPHPNDQYAIDMNSVISVNNGSGDDWAIFGLYPNSNTGLTAAAAQGAYFRLAYDGTINLSESDVLRITGYGSDDTPSGPAEANDGHCPNSDHKTLQTATGPYSSNFTHTTHAEIPIAGGNSGSPLIYDDNINLSIGIVTHASQRVFVDGNPTYLFKNSISQRFTREALRNAINDFQGNNVEYVDGLFPTQFGDGIQGNYFNPHSNVEKAVNNAASGAVISIVEGEYFEAFTINKAVTLKAAVGKVIIGGSLSSSNKLVNYNNEENNTIQNVDFRLENNYPNPFNPSTVIRFQVPFDTKVRLEIFDILGRRVAVLLNEQIESGIHEIVWDASNMASGIYFYRLQGLNFTDTRNMLLIK